MYPPPRKNNTGLIVGILGGVVVVVLAVVLVIVLANDDKGGANGLDNDTRPSGPGLPNGSAGDGDSSDDNSGGAGGDGGPSPEAMADEVVRIVEQHDTETIRRYACTEQEAADLYHELARLDGVEIDAEVKDVTKSGNTAQASITMSAGGQTEEFTAEMMKNDGGLWCVTGI